MKLLTKTEVNSRKQLENETLIASNIRLRTYERDITKKLNNIKDTYEPDKLKRLEEFERFCKDIEVKRIKVLKELAQWQKLVDDTKEIYYGFIARKDELQEKEYQIQEENKKLDLRQTFITDLEAKWREKQ